MGGSRVETISRLAQWTIDNFDCYTSKRSDPFKFGIWSWRLSFQNNGQSYINLEMEPSEQAVLARFVLRVSGSTTSRPLISPVCEKFLKGGGFLWFVKFIFQGQVIIDVEFLDLKIYPNNGGDPYSIWSSDGTTQPVSSQSTLRCLSRMLDESIHADVTINLADGSLRAHKAILSACSPVFQAMFHHDLREKESSMINIDDMSLESCSTLLSYLYGSIKQEEFLKHRLTLAVAANKYNIADLRYACEESLLEDINTGNVLDILQEAWFYQLDKLKEGCFRYLFEFGKFYDVRDEMKNLIKQGDQELMNEMFQRTLEAFGPI